MATNAYSALPATDDLAFVFARAGKKLLSPEEEKTLAGRIWSGRRELARLFSEKGEPASPTSAACMEAGGCDRPLDPHEVKDLLEVEKRARRAVEEAHSEGLRASAESALAEIDRAKEHMVHHNLRLVVWVAKRFVGKGLDFADLFQEGCMSLMEAVERFDPNRGNRLSTYAARAVHLGIVRALAQKGRMIRIPIHRLKEVADVTTAWAELRNSLGREPTDDEISQRSGIDKGEIAELAPALRPISSFDTTMPGTGLTYADVLADEGLAPSECAESHEAEALTYRALERLPRREKRILQLRYGLDGSHERTFEAIGREVGLSRERSRQLERVALGRMHSALNTRSKSPWRAQRAS